MYYNLKGPHYLTIGINESCVEKNLILFHIIVNYNISQCLGITRAERLIRFYNLRNKWNLI